jgi:hypothetical protein
MDTKTPAVTGPDERLVRPGAEAHHWPQVIAYPGGDGGLGDWVDISTGDGPENVTRYVPQHAIAAEAARVKSLIRRLAVEARSNGDLVRDPEALALAAMYYGPNDKLKGRHDQA